MQIVNFLSNHVKRDFGKKSAQAAFYGLTVELLRTKKIWITLGSPAPKTWKTSYLTLNGPSLKSEFKVL